jgi:hypothetical protein
VTDAAPGEDEEDVARKLVGSAEWRWCPGMVDQAGGRVVDVAGVADTALPDLADWATAGAVLGLIAARGALTDVVRDSGNWIVAVDIEGDISGYAAETLGEAAGWALMAVWENLPPAPGGMAEELPHRPR